VIANAVSVQFYKGVADSRSDPVCMDTKHC